MSIPASSTGHYAIDPSHTDIGFAVRHAMISKVRGSFSRFSGSGYLDAEDPSRSSLELTIDAASIDTRNADRDGHLRSADFLDVEHYPEIRFVSTSVEPLGDDRFRVTGDLTIRDVTRPVSFELTYTGAVKDPFGNQRIGLEGTTTIDRREWGLTWNTPLDTGGVLVGEKVTLDFQVEAIRTDERHEADEAVGAGASS
ncbi:MAG: YceI family protein [Acidimicrobiales bacterium]